jgi:hypothetical protein
MWISGARANDLLWWLSYGEVFLRLALGPSHFYQISWREIEPLGLGGFGPQSLIEGKYHSPSPAPFGRKIKYSLCGGTPRTSYVPTQASATYTERM